MAEEGIYTTYATPDNVHMSPTSQVDSGTEGNIYTNESLCGRPERATASKPSGAVKNYTRWPAVCLGLLCVLLLALNIGLGIKYVLDKRQLQAERNHLLVSYVNITMERDQVSASNTNLTRQMDQLLVSYVNITMERDQALASNTNLTRLVDQLLSTNDQLQVRHCESLLRPSGRRYFNSKLYLIYSERKTWSESRQHCIECEGDLVIINSKEEQLFIHGLGIPAWIGLWNKGGWKWVDNTQLSTSYWDRGQPGRTDENCVLIDVNYGDKLSCWHDYPCSEEHHFICEIPA